MSWGLFSPFYGCLSETITYSLFVRKMKLSLKYKVLYLYGKFPNLGPTLKSVKTVKSVVLAFFF